MCCFSISFLVLLLLLWQAVCWFLCFRCHLLTALLPSIWSWTLPAVVYCRWWHLALVLLVLLTLTLDFSVLSSIPYAAVFSTSFFGQVLQLTVTAYHRVNIVCLTQVADRSTTDRDRSVALVAWSWRTWMTCMSSSSMLNPLRTYQRPPCHIWSNSFLQSMKLWNRSLWFYRCLLMSALQFKFIRI